MRHQARVTKAYDSYLDLAFERALHEARRAGADFARVLMREAPSPPAEEQVSVCLDLERLSDDELRLLSQWEGKP